MIYAGLSIAILSLLLLQYVEFASFFALAFGLFGMAPAGLIIAFSGAAMAAERRASGMGFYFSIYFLVVTPAPAIAGWLLDRSGDAYDAIIFAALLFALTAAAAVCFQICRRRLAAAADLP
jgi:predicted MFS family arabinose efflux permease